uniref:Uncharacterized protein n=1 Tax=Oryza glumipatula TaxID=40148 RepID=A0A0E0AXJ0_9ORYZ
MAGHHQALDLHLLLSPIPKPLLATTLPFKCARTLQAALAVPIRSQFHAAIWEKYNTIINCLLWKHGVGAQVEAVGVGHRTRTAGRKGSGADLAINKVKNDNRQVDWRLPAIKGPQRGDGRRSSHCVDSLSPGGGVLSTPRFLPLKDYKMVQISCYFIASSISTLHSTLVLASPRSGLQPLVHGHGNRRVVRVHLLSYHLDETDMRGEGTMYLQKPLYFRTEAWVVEMTTLQGQLWQVKVADQSGKTSTGALGSRYDDE